jgi:hypothetical protein
MKKKWAYSATGVEASGAISRLPRPFPLRILQPVTFFFFVVGRKKSSLRHRLAVDRNGAERATDAETSGAIFL